MVKLPDYNDPTLAAADAAMVAQQPAVCRALVRFSGGVTSMKHKWVMTNGSLGFVLNDENEMYLIQFGPFGSNGIRIRKWIQSNEVRIITSKEREQFSMHVSLPRS